MGRKSAVGIPGLGAAALILARGALETLMSSLDVAARNSSDRGGDAATWPRQAMAEDREEAAASERAAHADAVRLQAM